MTIGAVTSEQIQRSRGSRSAFLPEGPGACLTDHPPTGKPAGDRRGRSLSYGFVVESVNVSVLLYVPVRRASLAPMACLKATDTGSLLTGPE
jgi:hypothetical protein